MTHSQACEPCAKRKVRCDHGEPCSNCKRRKTDRCTYSSVSPQDRIRQLEALVKDLRARVDSNTDKADARGDDGVTSSGNAIEVRSKDPVVLESDGQSFYLESRAWQGWMGFNPSEAVQSKLKLPIPHPLQERPHALATLSAGLTNVDLHESYPSASYIQVLWNNFMDRVEPIVRICFRWWLKELRNKSLDFEACRQLSGAEHAILSAIYLVSVRSMTDKECQNTLDQPKDTAILQYQSLCENALLRTNLFCMNDVTVIKAAIFYIMSGYDRLSSSSLWSFIGLIIRNAEKLGMHRDGTVLGLSPVQTEERRRTWWHLQHLDLGIAVRVGSTPMTLMADWDAKLPLNIEDNDIGPDSTELPPARKGLTSVSFNRYCYFVIKQQREIFEAKKGRFALSWQSNTALPSSLKDSVIDELEQAVNKEFLQYCDPIKPLHALLQLLARYLTAGMKLRMLHPLIDKEEKGDVSHERRSAILEASMQCLRYFNAVQSNLELKRYYWFTKSWAPFHAFMCVLIEAVREEDTDKAQEIWDLLSNTYAINDTFWELSTDRRNYQAAEHVVKAWKTWQKKFGSSLNLSNPDFAEKLEAELARQRTRTNGEVMHEFAQQPQPQQQSHVPETALLTPESPSIEGDMNIIFNMDFQNVDWSFWSGVE